VSAATLGSSPKPFSRSAETGRSVASTMARAWARASSRCTLPSRRPRMPAEAPLEVASAGKPRPARMRAEPASQGVGITRGRPLVKRAEAGGLVALTRRHDGLLVLRLPAERVGRAARIGPRGEHAGLRIAVRDHGADAARADLGHDMAERAEFGARALGNAW